MPDQFIAFCEELQKDIQAAYESSPTPTEAEKLAAKFLDGQLQAAQRLAQADLDARMRKQGLKAIKASVYLKASSPADGGKKPTEAALEAMVNQDALVASSQVSFDEAEVSASMIQNYFNVFKEGHIYFRGISKGRFE